MGYDGMIGALVLFNTTEEEMLLLWEETGAITRVVDCPWVRMTTGPDVASTSGRRAYLTTSFGTIHCPDNEAVTTGVPSMCGVDGTTLGDFVVDTADSGTSTIELDGPVPLGVEGFYVYIYNVSQNQIVRRQITERVSSQELTITPAFGVGEDGSAGDTLWIAPVYMAVKWPQIANALPGPPNTFHRHVTSTMALAGHGIGVTVGSTYATDWWLGLIVGEEFDILPTGLGALPEPSNGTMFKLSTPSSDKDPDQLTMASLLDGYPVYPYLTVWELHNTTIDALQVAGRISPSYAWSNVTDRSYKA
jgi:hypothetical protein